VGQGGMATVYLARDLRHGRRVAVKVLRPDLSATLAAERFLREIRIAARLHHPNILMLIDSGEAGGLLFYVMPFVDGESLRQRLDRERPLPAADVVRIAAQVADALEYAHAEGVVHRDIKPENILFAAGHAVVADFGIARAVSTAADRPVTRTGYPVGTVGYMSPEQAAGFTDLTPRTDVYSLGCVAYEMLVGEPPGHWPSDESGRVLRLLEAPPGHRARLDRLPGSAEQALVRALRMRPDDRCPGPRTLAEALGAAFGEKPRFSETRARAIVARAADLEASAPTGAGLSLGGIQQLAAEVGIPPEHVEAAARDLVPAPAPRRHWFLGAPSRIVVERLMDRPVEEDDFATLVDEVRMTVGNVGQASQLGRSLAWRSVNPPGHMGRDVSLTVTPVGDRTRLRLEEGLGQTAGGLFGGIMGGAGGPGLAASIVVGAKVAASALVGVSMAVAIVASAYGVARALYRGSHRRRREELEALADRLTSFLAVGGNASRRLPRGRGGMPD
jgi:tRNA A-37 threonylcarbamoyl transferase component Bud32